MAETPMMLDGIRVLGLSRVIAGPYCATLMADLGADVVKVERPGRGDDLRAWRGSGMSATFAAINRNKRGIAVDLQQPEGSTLRTKDGWVQVVIMNPDQYARFCRALGDESLAIDPQFSTNDSRVAHHDELRDRIERALARDTTAGWVTRFETEQVAAGPIYEFDEVFADPQVKHLGLVAEVDQPGYGPARMLAFPVKASATPGTIRRPAPRLGEHTAEVLSELGLTKPEIERLAAAGVVALA